MTINVDVGLKKVIYVKKIKFGILLHVFLKIENRKYLGSITDFSAIMGDEVIVTR